MENKSMTVKEGRSLSQRDLENGAVRREIYYALKEREALTAEVERLTEELRLYVHFFGKANKYFNAYKKREALKESEG